MKNLPIILESRKTEQEIRKNEKIITQVVEASEFFPAEDYHQKYRLQAHRDLAKQIGIGSNSKLLQTSHVAARLNGFLGKSKLYIIKYTRVFIVNF
jgi:peptide-methionine (S)-S-oxide reductase